ncbi:hypothetical protein jhhlp_003320 [Lomentospora prolificans]|uniref:tyrosinase n=1 Tax=Lomentospora prolificans TaxID=41688 RepID=A0A2N3NGK1_9PEZI|nr:hypothetical protein jhhlp_003320 [Lomentospora prolificans]
MKSPRKLLPIVALCLATLASAKVSITGAKTGINPLSGEVPSRLNINTLHQQGGPAWSLYVRALAAMQAVKPNEVLSYFQIMGIHGRPLIPWDDKSQAAGPNGYCPHAENLFLPWHRSYLALFEQVLVDHAIALANEYPITERSKYRSAAESLRIPYWDWAEDATIPPAVGQPEIQVDTPEGQKTIRNPLYSYNFPEEAVRGDYGSITGTRDRRQTKRCSPAEANARLSAVNFKGLVYDAFTRSDTFAKVASVGSDGVVMSFEQPHNSVHIRAACGNNFAYPSDAAFDPLFMLHHANVDRLWAMWEELYPSERALTPPYQSGGTYAIAPGTTITNTSPLLPFYGAGDNAHTSAQVQDTAAFGYTYPEINRGASSADARRDGMRATVNKLYGPGARAASATPSSAAPNAANSNVTRRQLEEVVHDVEATISPNIDDTVDNVRNAVTPRAQAEYADLSDIGDTAKDIIDDTVDAVVDTVTDIAGDVVDFVEELLGIEFFAQIRVNGANVPTPCEVNVYIGGRVAGSFDILTAPHGGGVVEGEIPLEDLIESFDLRSAVNESTHAVSILGQNVHVEFLHPDGTPIPSDQYDGQVEISLIDIDVTSDSNPDTFPVYGESRRTNVSAKPAPLRTKCRRSNRYADLPGVKLRV